MTKKKTGNSPDKKPDSINEKHLIHTKVKFEVFGEEMMEKVVKTSGNSGRIYLPPNWIGHKVKIIKLD